MTQPITALSLTRPSLRHGFFTREGGVSGGEYASLNVGRGSGDALENVEENRRRVAAALGSKHADIVTCHQTHSGIVHVVEAFPQAPLTGDALVTNVPSLPIAVLTADCVPVLLADVTHGVIGAVHSGWKGAAQQIVGETVTAMEAIGAKREAMVAVIGPAIAGVSYEVGVDLKERFAAIDASYAEFFLQGSDAAHVQFDLPELVTEQTRRLGVAKVEKLDYDTYADEQRFFSFRRSTHHEQTVYGRQCSAIMLA